MKEITEAEREEFLKQLSKLTRQYKIMISGCGCCGSPFLERCVAEGEYVLKSYGENDYLTWESAGRPLGQ